MNGLGIPGNIWFRRLAVTYTWCVWNWTRPWASHSFISTHSFWQSCWIKVSLIKQCSSNCLVYRGGYQLEIFFSKIMLNICVFSKFCRNDFNISWLELIYFYTDQFYRKKHVDSIKKMPSATKKLATKWVELELYASPLSNNCNFQLN